MTKPNISADTIGRLIAAFPDSVINQKGEFIAHIETNQYFILVNCENELDVKCKVLEWLSRPAFKSEPYNSDIKNERLHEFMLNGINEFLGTSFTESDIMVIYQLLGNSINRSRTIEFVESGYDMTVLTKYL